MANKVKFNLKNVHIAPMGESGYETPFALPGAVSLTLDAEGDIEKFYADGIAYYQSATNNGYSGSLEVALITDEFRTKILNEALDNTSKTLLENVSQEIKSFALAFQVDGDVDETLFWYYNCTVTRPSTEASTLEESKTPQTESMNISCVPTSDGNIRVRTTSDTPEATKTNWFKSVFEKSA